VRITSLALTDLRRYHDREFELAPGLNIVRGPNEAGKSTIQRAIELALTRKVTSSAADLDGLVSWNGQEDARTTIALTFTYEDDEGESREGRLAKSFRGSRGQVRLDLGGETISDPARADEELAAISGVPTEGFFRSTASVRHHELAGLQRDESALRDRLQTSISGADRGISRARRKLERAIHDLQTRGIKNPGRLRVAEEAVADAASRLQAGEDALQNLERDRDALAVAREHRAEAETALAERRSMLEKARQAERLTAERDAAQEKYERYRQAVVLRDEIAELERTHPSPTPLPVLRSSVDRLRTVDSKIATLQAMLEGEVHVNYEAGPEVRWRPLSRWSLVLVLIGLAIANISFLLSFADIISIGIAPIVVGLVIAAIGLVLAIVGWWLRRSAPADESLRQNEVDRRLRGRSEIEQELREAQAEHDDLLQRLGLTEFAEAEERLGLEEAHVAEIDQRRAHLSGLIGDEKIEALPARRDNAALEIEQKAAALEALGPIAKEPRARERLEVEVVDAERQVERGRDDEANARARVEQNPVDAEEVATLAEKLAMGREALTALRRRERIYERTLAELNTAEQATMELATRYLERRMVPDVERITGGRYRRVRVDDSNLSMEVYAPERGDWVPVTDLSQGTVDVIYLAARIGLVRLVTGDRRPPIILDDPFVTLDDGRAARALELLRDLAADFQVIYLTTSDRYDALAEKVIVLDGPTAVDAYLEPEVAAPG
jgi:DNA repair exonuclease SbcCD ATPase subunit